MEYKENDNIYFADKNTNKIKECVVREGSTNSQLLFVEHNNQLVHVFVNYCYFCKSSAKRRLELESELKELTNKDITKHLTKIIN